MKIWKIEVLAVCVWSLIAKAGGVGHKAFNANESRVEKTFNFSLHFFNAVSKEFFQQHYIKP